MTFRNSVVGGTTLVRPAIKSPNYVANSTGWSINADGSAEFSNIVIRGAATGDTVVIGPSSGSQVLIGYSGTVSRIQFPMHSPAENTASVIFGRVQNSGTNSEILDLNFWGPKITGGNQIQVSVGSGNVVGTIPARFSVVLNGTTTMMFIDDVNGMAISEPTTISTAVNEIPLTINAPTTPGVNLIEIATGATDELILDQTGVFTTYAANTFTTYTPTVSGGGTATFSTKTGWYQRIGKMVFFTAYVVVNAAGSGASNVQVTTPSSIDRTTRQAIFMHGGGIAGPGAGEYTALCFTSGSGSTIDRLTRGGANLTGADLSAGGILTITGWYREA